MKGAWSNVAQKSSKLPVVGKNTRALRRIHDFSGFEGFDVPEFCVEALNTYIKVHEALANEDEEELHKYVTDRCFPELVHQTYLKTIKWKFIKSLQKEEAVQYKWNEGATGDNQFVQITVKFHTQQILAIYDRFGRLQFGSEHVVKDVLEYVVFENHIVNQYGSWKIHGKIIPPSVTKTPILRTYVREKEAEVENMQVEQNKKEDGKKVNAPTLVTA